MMEEETKVKVENRRSKLFFPSSRWGEPPESLEFSSLESFLMLLHDLHGILLCEMQKNPHDLFHNILCFYEEFLNQERNLEEFLLHYEPRLYPEYKTCLNLHLALMEQMRKMHGCLATTSSFFLAAYWDIVPDGYPRHSPPPDDVITQHTVVVLKVSIEGGRQGYVLFDLGMYIPNPVVVMADGMYPHTGWCQQHVRQPYMNKSNYVLEGDYVIRNIVRPSNNLVEKRYADAIYVGGAFLSFMERSEKRSLVSVSIRVLMVQDRKGILAGIVFKEKIGNCLNFCYTDESDTFTSVPVPFDYLLGPRDDSHFEDAIATCFSQMRMDKELLNKKINHFIEAFSNPKFIDDARRLDKEFDL